MGHIQDRWTRPGPSGRRVHTDRYGRGLRWQAIWQDRDGQRHRRGFPTKDAAIAHLAKTQVDQSTGAYVSPARTRITLGQWAVSWQAAQAHLKPSGAERVRGILQLHILPRWGTVALGDITHEDAQAWVNGLPGAPPTVQRVHGVLARMLDGAMRAHRIPVNEARGVNLPRRSPREHRYLTVVELDALLEHAGAWAAFTRCLALTGLRVGEAAELRVRDVDLARRRVTVSRSMTTLGGRRVTGTPKTATGRRTVPLPTEVLADVTDLARGHTRDALVYTTPRGAQVRKDNYRRAFIVAAARAGLTGLRPHDLRHTAVSLAVASGASVKAVQRMVGHASAAITLDVYAGLFDQDLDDVTTRVDALLRRERARACSPHRAPEPLADSL